MKVIQGKHKGTILKGFDINGTRPTMDRVKESLFAMIQNDIYNKSCLDLFAGSGNLGIEALSMQAKQVVFVDHNQIAIKTIKENLSKVHEHAEVINLDYQKALNYFYQNHITFDIIFLDPPYQTDYIKKSIELIDKYNLLNKNGLLICESDAKEKLSGYKNYQEVKTRKYGQKIVVILKN